MRAFPLARLQKLLKPIVFLAALVPFVALAAAALLDQLGANPIQEITHVTGDWTLRFVLITLAITPLRRLTGWNALIKYRRMLGLFAFFYSLMHFGTYIVLDQFFAWDLIGKDIVKRPFITVGFLGFTAMVPLALTSTTGWIRRLGGKRWQQLHRLIYVTAVAGVVHYLWLVKVVGSRQLAYAAVLTVLLGLRIWYAWQRRAPLRAVRAETASTAS
jgi:sulfoxide reductase heme-binding subunit YedZ